MNTQFATIFKRLKQKKEDELPLKPIDIIFGEIKESNGKKIFVSSNGEIFKCGDDVDSMNDAYVYGYPYSIDEFLKSYTGDCDYVKMSYNKNNHFCRNGVALMDDIDEPFIKEAFLEYLNSLSLYYFYQKYHPSAITMETYRIRKVETHNLTYFDNIDIDLMKDELEIDVNVDTDTSYIEFDNISPNYNVKDVINKVCRRVINQNEAVESVVSSVSANHHITDRSIKRNILLIGPTGCGKTEIFRAISKELKIPIVMEDATQYTASGYVGRSTESMITDLIDAADGSIEKAQYGIILIDEIDKKANRNDNESISTSAVLDSLLKPLDGDPIIIDYKKKTLTFDLTHTTFGFAGAFSGLEKEYVEHIAGFCSDVKNSKIMNEVEKFNDYGIKPEFISRMSVIEYLNSLNEDDLLNILINSTNSPIIKNIELFKRYNTKLTIIDKAIKEIAKEASLLNKGARSLNIIVNNAIKKALIDAQSDKSIKEVIIDDETIHDNKKYVLKR